MEKQFSEDDEIAVSYITDEDMLRPIDWLKRLSSFQLKLWLRRAVWTGRILPFHVPLRSLLVPYLEEKLSESEELVTRLRAVVPSLLAEWGQNDPPFCLEDLLVLSAALRCADARPSIVNIVLERLNGYFDEVRLRQLGLGVLSGLDVTDQTAHVFNRYFRDFNYTAFCYRALYRYKLPYAIEKLPILLDVYVRENALKDLRKLLNVLLFEYLTKEQRVENFWRYLLLNSKPEELRTILLGLNRVHITLLPPPESYDEDEEQDYLVASYNNPYERLSVNGNEATDSVGIKGIEREIQLVVINCGIRYAAAAAAAG
jgi:hypothetical protein